ncbi:Glutamyl-tRNA reductase [Madurella fahalii]|uniref:Glutamyl-tRNA reductase n=1 Tax=Madurella fahalii TaxID=1157608 RepID=A0ABQ0G1B3_9PEZI
MHPLTPRWCSHSGPCCRVISTGPVRRWVRPSRPLWPARQIHHQKPVGAAAAIVVGAGPAGIAAVGNLLEAMPDGKIIWVDKSFEGGRLGRLLREVPSYTAVGDFLEYARALSTFRKICDEAPTPNAVTALEALRPDRTCLLSYAGDMLKFITNGLLTHDRVIPITGNVTESRFTSEQRKIVVSHPHFRRVKHLRKVYLKPHWSVTIDLIGAGSQIETIRRTAPMLVYCIGARPRHERLPFETSSLTLEIGLTPSRLGLVLPSDEPRKIAVVGDSLSAVLVLRNLYNLYTTTHPLLKVCWLPRSPNLKFAKPDESTQGGVANDLTGLKGEAAVFARTHLDGDALDRSPVGKLVERVVYPGHLGLYLERSELDTLLANLGDADHVFQCIGYKRRTMPDTLLGPTLTRVGGPKRFEFNGVTGAFYTPSIGPKGTMGLFGAGAGFPEWVFRHDGDPPEHAVGVLKFMRFLQKAVPKWVEENQRGVSELDSARDKPRPRSNRMQDYTWRSDGDEKSGH